jgi:CubicO group peptidase (beta-lactamase class C family)
MINNMAMAAKKTAFLRIALFLSVLVIFSSFGMGSDEIIEHSSIPVDFSQLDKTVMDELKEKDVPGASLAIVSGNEVIYSKGYGVADIETNSSVTPDTLFRIASTTKIFTALSLLSLEVDGRVDLDVPVGRYILGLSPGLSNVTGRQLLSHTAGLVNGGENYGRHDESGLAEGIRSWNDSVLFTKPGEVYSYSNRGFALAGLLLQEAAKKPYADEISESVLKPLGMNRSTFRPTEAMTYPFSQGYRQNKTGKLEVIRPFEDSTTYWPAGFMFSSANDLSRLAIALMDNGSIDGKHVLSATAIQDMESPHADIPSFPDNRTYGYGLMIHNYRGLQIVEHSGDIDGFACRFKMVPNHRFAVIVLCNRNVEMNRTYEKAFQLMLSFKQLSFKQAEGWPTKTWPINKSEIAWLEGEYYQSPSFLLTLEKSDIEHYMKKIDANHFILQPPNGQMLVIAVIPGQDGKIKYLQIDGESMKKNNEVRKR